MVTRLFPNGIDTPLVIDATYRFTNQDRALIDAQIRGIQAFLTAPTAFSMPDANATLPGSAWSQQVIVVRGTLSLTRALTIPTTAGLIQSRLFLNATNQPLTLTPVSGGTTASIPANSFDVIVYDGANMFGAGVGGGGGGGGTYGTDLVAIDATHQKVIGFNAIPLNQSGTAGQGKVWVYDTASTSFSLRKLTNDDLGSPFSVSLSLASGGTGPFEIGTSWTPTFNATPLTNDASVTGCTIADNRGNGPTSVSSGAALPAPVSGGTYTTANTTAINTPNNTVVVTVSETSVSTGTTKTASVTGTYRARAFYGPGTAGATGLTASGNNATLGGATGTLTGFLDGGNVQGNSGFAQSVTCSNQKLYVYIDSWVTTSFTSWVDKLSTSAFDMKPTPTTITFVNQNGVSRTGRLYESTNLLNGTFAPYPVS